MIVEGQAFGIVVTRTASGLNWSGNADSGFAGPQMEQHIS